MSISSYQIDGVLKAYVKQYKSKVTVDNAPRDKYADVITLSKYEDVSVDLGKKMTGSFIEILKSLRKSDHY